MCTWPKRKQNTHKKKMKRNERKKKNHTAKERMKEMMQINVKCSKREKKRAVRIKIFYLWLKQSNKKKPNQKK